MNNCAINIINTRNYNILIHTSSIFRHSLTSNLLLPTVGKELGSKFRHTQSKEEAAAALLLLFATSATSISLALTYALPFAAIPSRLSKFKLSPILSQLLSNELLQLLFNSSHSSSNFLPTTLSTSSSFPEGWTSRPFLFLFFLFSICVGYNLPLV